MDGDSKPSCIYVYLHFMHLRIPTLLIQVMFYPLLGDFRDNEEMSFILTADGTCPVATEPNGLMLSCSCYYQL